MIANTFVHSFITCGLICVKFAYPNFTKLIFQILSLLLRRNKISRSYPLQVNIIFKRFF